MKYNVSRKKAQKHKMKKTDKEIYDLCDRIREISYSLHRFLRHGHLEKVYENGLANRLQKAGINFTQQQQLEVYDEDGTVLGHFVADLFVEDCLIIELKACRQIIGEHIAQILGYMRACRVEHGLIINFGSQRLEIKKFILTEK